MHLNCGNPAWRCPQGAWESLHGGSRKWFPEQSADLALEERPVDLPVRKLAVGRPQPDTHTRPERDPSRRLDYRRGVTRIKGTCGAAQDGLATRRCRINGACRSACRSVIVDDT